jgi:hypothetical protein
VNAPKMMYNKKLHNLYSSPNIIRVIPRRITGAKYVAYIGEVRNACKILAEKHQESKTLGRIILRRNLEKYGVNRFKWVRAGSSDRLF